jgi:predicted patatin/cPLA2 family phospholipase
MRGIFSAGVLDVLHEQGVKFDLAIGTSAGAANLASFVAGQHERNLRAYVDIMTRTELFSLRRALGGGHYMDLDWLWDRFAAEIPLDESAIAQNPTQLVSVATCAVTSAPVYLEARPPDVHVDIKGACALPLLYRGPVMVQGRAVVDGGLSDAIPAAEAYRRGARRIVVVRSRPTNVTKAKSALDPIMGLLLRGQPAVAHAMRETAARYQQAMAFIANPPSDAHLIQLAPEVPLRTGRTTQDKTVLNADYQLGRAMTLQVMPQIASLVSS